MLFMVVETFRDLERIDDRFHRQGRMMPDGLSYHASWIDAGDTRCFQLMETGDAELLQAWMSHWNDVMDFEVVPVLTSADFWGRRRAG